MPIHTFRTESGESKEVIFYPGEGVPDTIRFNGQEARRVPSVCIAKFKGEFSGDTPTKNLKFPDDGTIVESGVKRDVERQRKHLQEQRDRKRRKFVEDQVSTYSL